MLCFPPIWQNVPNLLFVSFSLMLVIMYCYVAVILTFWSSFHSNKQCMRFNWISLLCDSDISPRRRKRFLLVSPSDLSIVLLVKHVRNRQWNSQVSFCFLNVKTDTEWLYFKHSVLGLWTTVNMLLGRVFLALKLSVLQKTNNSSPKMDSFN